MLITVEHTGCPNFLHLSRFLVAFTTPEPRKKDKKRITMDSSLYTQWSSQPQLLPDSGHQHEARSSALVDDWTKDRLTTAGQAGGSSASLAAGAGLEMSDFTTLAEGELQCFLLPGL